MQQIWTLIQDSNIRQQLCIAVGTVLGFLPDEQPDYCSETRKSTIFFFFSN